MSWPHAEHPSGSAGMIQDGSTLQVGIDSISGAVVNVVVGPAAHFQPASAGVVIARG